MFTYTAATFNGNIVVGKGETLKEAKLDAENKSQRATALYLVSVYRRLSRD